MKRKPDKIVALAHRRVQARKQLRWFTPLAGAGLVMLCCGFLKMIFERQANMGDGLLLDPHFWFGVVSTIIFLFSIGVGIAMLLTLVKAETGIESDTDELLLELWKEQRGH